MISFFEEFNSNLYDLLGTVPVFIPFAFFCWLIFLGYLCYCLLF